MTTDQLIAEIRRHDALYWGGHAPEISDAEYDQLVAALELRGGARPESPTGWLSVEKVYSVDELLRRLPADRPVTVQPKVDGVAVRLRYGYDRLLCAETHGGDVTAKVRALLDDDGPYGRTRYAELCWPGTAYCDYGYASQRHGVAATLRLADVSAAYERGLALPLYRDLPTRVVMDVAAELPGLYRWVHNLTYDCDGLVFLVGGRRIALKLRPAALARDASHAEWRVGRTGRLVPVLRIAPTMIDGQCVTRVGLGSAGNAERQGLAVAPTRCPVCNSEIVRRGQHAYCDNGYCRERVAKRIVADLRERGVRGIGLAAVRSILSAGLTPASDPAEVAEVVIETRCRGQIEQVITLGRKRAEQFCGTFHKTPCT